MSLPKVCLSHSFTHPLLITFKKLLQFLLEIGLLGCYEVSVHSYTLRKHKKKIRALVCSCRATQYGCDQCGEIAHTNGVLVWIYRVRLGWMDQNREEWDSLSLRELCLGTDPKPAESL